MSRAARIMHVTKRYPDARGGDATLVSGLVGVQRAQGRQVCVVTSNCREIADGPQVYKPGFRLGQSDLDVLGWRRVVNLVLLLFWSYRLLRKERPDVVHAHAPELGAAFALSARLLGVGRVLTLHGTAIGNPLLSRAKGRLERMLVRCGGYGALLTVDPSALPALAGLSRAPASFVFNAIDADGFLPRCAPRGVSRLLFVGRLEPVKGLDVLLTSLAAVRGRGHDCVLDLVGDGSLAAALRRQVVELGLAGKVSFHGSRTPEQVRGFLQRSSALVISSTHEGFPMVLLEAWASGVPVVTTSVGAAGVVCTDGVDALVVPPRDPVALAAALETLLRDGELAMRIGRAGRGRVAGQYTYEALGEELDRHYDLVTAPTGAPAGRSG